MTSWDGCDRLVIVVKSRLFFLLTLMVTCTLALPSGAAAPTHIFVLDEGWNLTSKYYHWTQNTDTYNRYTPYTLSDSENSESAKKYSYAGCTAVAGAAVLQFFNVSSGPSDVTKICHFNGSAIDLTTKGGVYDWSWPDFYYNPESNDVRPRALYDVGVCSQMHYRNGNGQASVAQLYTLAPALKEYFGFTSAEYIVGPVHENLVYNQLRCGIPVILDVYGNGNTGHTITTVGYGEMSDGSPCAYVFMGYAGVGDGWCNLPNVQGFTWMMGGISGFAYQDDKCVALVGKVLDAQNQPVVGEEVKVSVTDGAEVVVLKTGQYGEYATRVSAANKSYTLSVNGYQAREVSLEHTKFPDPVNFTPGEAPQPLIIYDDADKAFQAAKEQKKLIFGMSGRDGLGWAHHVQDVLQEMGDDFAKNYIFYYQKVSGNSVTCKIFKPIAFIPTKEMENTAFVEVIKGYNYSQKDVVVTKETIANQLRQAVLSAQSNTCENWRGFMPWAIWNGFTEDNATDGYAPTVAFNLDGVDANFWRLRVNGGKVNQDDELCTGTGIAPVIDFGKSLDLGSKGTPITLVMTVKEMSPTLNKPIWQFAPASGTSTLGMALAFFDSKDEEYEAAVKAIQGDKIWTDANNYIRSIDALASPNSVTLAFKTSGGLSVREVVVNNHESKVDLIDTWTGLNPASLSAQMIQFGNYTTATETSTDGLNYTIEKLAVFRGDVTDEALVDFCKNTLVVNGDVTLTALPEYMSLVVANGTLKDDAGATQNNQVTVKVQGKAELTLDGVTTEAAAKAALKNLTPTVDTTLYPTLQSFDFIWEYQPITNEAGTITGYQAALALNPQTVTKPSVGAGENGATPFDIGNSNTQGEREIKLSVTGAVEGLYYGYMVGDELLEITQDTTTPFERAEGSTVNLPPLKYTGEKGFFKVMVLPYNPNPKK